MSILRTFPVLAAFGVAGLALASGAQAESFTFNQDPFAGSTALTTPGRQVVGGERFIGSFDIAGDVLLFDPDFFDIPNGLSLFNGVAGAIPASGFNVIVLGTFDGDGDLLNGNQLNAGTAANLIAADITGPGAGFFIYFNSGLDLPRLVYSTDLSDPTADLKVLARFTNQGGQAGRDGLPGISADNVGNVPEPAAWAMMIAGFGMVGAMARRRRPIAVAA